MPNIFLFPGQGSQFVGMGHFLKGRPEADEVFRIANSALNFSLEELMWEGPEDKLTQTQFAQPAILTVEIAVARVLQSKGIVPSCMAGHSLGEYACLVLSNAMKFEDAVVAVHRRGLHMQAAVPLGTGTMSAILGLDNDSIIEEVCQQITASGFLVEPANYNCPGQLVISGTIEGVQKASALLKEKGAKRCIPLQVSAPFHCSLLKPAGVALGKDLEKIKFQDPQVPYVANVDVETVVQADGILRRLIDQVFSPVRWTQTLQKITREFPKATYIEVGPGRVISGHMKKVNDEIKTHSTDTLESLQVILEK